jgi:hypothetical protein
MLIISGSLYPRQHRRGWKSGPRACAPLSSAAGHRAAWCADLDDDDPDDQPLVIEGEPLSETIRRERR